MLDRPHAPRTPLQAFALIALAQALLFCWLRQATDDAIWPATAPGVFNALLLASVFAPAAAYLLVPDWAGRRAGIALGILMLFLLAAGAHYGLAVLPPSADPYRGDATRVALFGQMLLLLFVSLSWFVAALATGRAWPAYPALFRRGAENLVLFALSIVVCGLLWLLMVVTALLFRMIGIDVLEVLLFRIERITVMILALSIAAAVYVVTTTPKLLPTLLEYALSLVQRVLPFAIVLLYGFVIALAWRTPAILASHERVIGAQWLLWMSAIVLLLLNASWRDGLGAAPARGLLPRLVSFAPVPLVLLAALATYAIAVRIDAYGLTVQRVEAMTAALVCLAAAAGYLLVPLTRRGPAAVGLVNRGLAVALAATLILMALPPLSPQRLAAIGMRRFIILHRAAPERGGIASLWYDDGRYGREEVARLAAQPAAADWRVVQALAAEVMQSASRRGFMADPTPAARWEPARLHVYPAGTPIPPGWLEAMNRVSPNGALCTVARPCALIFQSLSGGTPTEVLLISGDGGGVYRDTSGGWKAVASLHLSTCAGCSRAGFYEALARGPGRVRPSEWQVLEAGGTTVRVDATP